MSETRERVGTACPSCSPDEPTAHEVLKPGGQATVRCTACSHVHKVKIETQREVERDVVVSQDGESFTGTVEAPPDETVEVGDEFVLDTEAAIMLVRITGIEIGPEERTEEATMEDVATIWTRAVDNVSVDVTVHPTDGNRDQSRTVSLRVPGDHEFTVGEVESFGDERFTVEGIQVRNGTDYRFDKFDHEGDMVFAKDVKRLYARDETSDAWSVW